MDKRPAQVILERLEFLNGPLSQGAPWLVAGFVFGIIGLLLVEVPPFVLDLLLAANIAFSMAIVTLTIFQNRPTGFTVFPTILLLSSFVRVGLNTSTTRLILVRGEAGTLVEAFSRGVSGGEPAVGAVLCLILFLVQFLVISKGTERASEVLARFSLDSLPGRQLSIDSDLRSVLIDQKEAQRRRKQLEQESDFHAALDGAMKFVKGEALVGLVITLLNLLAGTAIGCAQHHLPLSAALAQFGSLTIGDSLITLVPSILAALSAGLIITRVAGADAAESSLGTDILTQVTTRPEGLLMGGLSLLLLATLATGPARLLLALLGLIVTLVSGAALAAKRQSAKAGQAGARAAGPGGAAGAADGAPTVGRLVAPLELYMSDRLYKMCGLSDDNWRMLGQEMQDALYRQLGLDIPPPAFLVDKTFPDDQVQILIREDRVAELTVSPTEVLLLMSPGDVELRGLSGRALSDPLSGAELTAVSAEHRAEIDEDKLEIYFTWRYIASSLQSTVLRHAAEFVGIQETQVLLDRLTAEQPRLVEEMVPGVIGRRELAETLRRLAQEGLSIKDLQRILEAIAETPALVGHVPRLVEAVRRRLVPQLRGVASSKGRSGWTAHLPGPHLTALLRRSLKDGILHLNMGECREIFAALHAGLAPGKGWAERPVLVVDPALRPLLFQLLRDEFPTIVVLSSDEIDLVGGAHGRRVVDLKAAPAAPQRVLELPARVA